MTPITFHKAVAYRLAPTPEQASRLTIWSSCLVALWNDGARLCDHSSRLWRSGAHKPKKPARGHIWKVYMTTKAQEPDSDFARLPSSIVGALSQRFDAALDKMFKQRGAGAPQFKSMDRAPPSLEFPVYIQSAKDRSVIAVVFGKDSIRFPNPKNNKLLGLGRVKYEKHRKLPGVPKTASIARVGAKWFATVACEVKAALRASPAAECGIDVRLTPHLTLSNDGAAPIETLELMPEALRDRLVKRKTEAQRALARAKKGSARRKKTRAKLTAIEARIASVRRAAAHKATSYIASSYGFVAVEKLAMKKMVEKRGGAIPDAMRTHLNREMLNVAPATFRVMLESKMARRTGVFVAVNPAYTSQICSGCGHVAAENCRADYKFECVSCGFAASTPFNAATNIYRRGREDFGAGDRAETGTVAGPRQTKSRRSAASNDHRKPVFGPVTLPKLNGLQRDARGLEP